MSISSGAIRKAGPYTCNGSTAAFPFSFKVFQASDVLVAQTDLSGVETTKMLTTDYTVALNANQDSNPGGTVTMNTAPAKGYLITLGSQVTYTQGMVLTNTGGFFPQVINDMADRVVILVQQLYEKLSRALTLPFSASSGVSTQLPSPVAGKVIGWRADGLGLDNFDPSTAVGMFVSRTATSGSAVLPAGSTAQRDATPGGGYIRFNSTTNELEYYDGSAWASIADATMLSAALVVYYTQTQSDARYYTQAQADGRYSPIIAGLPTGAIFDFAGTAAPSGSLICPTTQTNISRTTYAALFAVIGTTWGAGDGSTTFGMPWFPGDYAAVQANSNVGTETAGQVITHTHNVGITINVADTGSAGGGVSTGGSTTTTSTGGSANLAAGVRVLKCIKY